MKIHRDNFLIVVLLLALFVRFMVAINYHKISPDGVVYSLIGDNLHHHLQYTTGLPQYPSMIQPPLFPIIIALFRIFTPLPLAGKIVSVIAGSLLIFPVYSLALFYINRQVARISALLIAIHPSLIDISVRALSESLYFLLVFSSVYYFWKFLNQKQSKALVYSAIGLSLSYLTRIESLFLIFIFLFILISVHLKERFSLKKILLWSGIIFLTFFTYAAWSSWNLQRPVLIPKIRFIRGHRLLYKHYLKYDPNFRQNDLQLRSKQVQTGLSKDHRTLASYDYFYNNQLPICNDPKYTESNSSIKSFIQLFKLLLYNSFLTSRKFLDVLPISMSLFLFLGLFKQPWDKHRFWLNLYLLSILGGMSLFLFSHVERRFIIAWIPIIILWMAIGIQQFAVFLQDSCRKIRGNSLSEFKSHIITMALGLLLLLPFYYRTLSSLYSTNIAYKFTQKLNDIIPAGSTISSSRNMQALYFPYRFYRLPFSTYGDLLDYLHYNRIQYVILEENHDKNSYPQLKNLFDPTFEADENLQRKALITIDSDRLFIYKVK